MSSVSTRPYTRLMREQTHGANIYRLLCTESACLPSCNPSPFDEALDSAPYDEIMSFDSLVNLTRASLASEMKRYDSENQTDQE